MASALSNVRFWGNSGHRLRPAIETVAALLRPCGSRSERAVAAAATLRLTLRSTAPRAPRDRHYVVAALHLTRLQGE